MPHIIYRGKAALEEVHARFAPAKREDNGWILKLTLCLISHDRRILAFETVAVRSGFSQNFYLRAEQKGDSVTLRVDPHTNVEKNEGVHRALLMVRDLVLQISPDLVFEKSNLRQDLLEGTGQL